MTLKNILKEIDVRMPSETEEDTVLMYINSALRMYGRHIGKRNMESFDGVAGINIYPLPSGVKEECIKSVTVNGIEREAKRYDERISDLSYSLEPTGYIMFYGKMCGGEKIKILHDSWQEAKYRDEMESDEEFEAQDLGVDNEYIGAVIFGALAEKSEVDEEIEAANNFRNKADEVVARATQGRYSKRGKYPKTRDVMKRG